MNKKETKNIHSQKDIVPNYIKFDRKGNKI